MVESPRDDVSLAPDWLTPPADLNELSAALWPRGTTRDATGQVIIAGQPVTRLVGEYGTPVVVLDEGDFRARARGFAEAFAGWGVYYAGKSFLCRGVARWVAEEGLNLDVCSGNELAVALSAGFPAARLGLHGNNKSVEELTAAVEAGVGRVIVDSLAEISRLSAIAAAHGTRVGVLVRVTTGVAAHTHEYVATATEDQKFGFSIASGAALAALRACHASPGLELRGLHSHIGSQIFDTAAFQVAAERVLGLVADFRAESGVHLPEIDLGGGFGIAYTCADTPLTPAELYNRLAAVLESARTMYGLGPLHCSIEPGRAISGPAGVALYTVGTVKPVTVQPGAIRTYVAVDGGMSDNIRPALYMADYSAVLANRASAAPPLLSRIVGKHCESGDILVRDVYLPADIQPGDIVAVPGAGAYARAMASNYNYLTRPPVVAATPARTYPLLRRETLADLLALDVG